MRFEDLKVGDKVYIREDLKVHEIYGGFMFMENMLKGKQEIVWILDESNFLIKGEPFIYTSKMIDWEKTSRLNEKYVKNIKPTYDGITLSLGDLKVTRHRDDKEDLEKAVMMLLLKKEGYSFGDVRRIVKNTKVKWVPKAGQKFFFITSTGNISSGVCYGPWSAHGERYMFGNYFRTKEEAEKKLEQIRKLLQED